MNPDPAARILVAGIGNVFLGDDAFGVEVLRHLKARPSRPEVRLVDFGIRALDLAYALLEDQDLTILVDATARGGMPGTIYTIEPDVPEQMPPGDGPHGWSPESVLALVASWGGPRGRVLLVGCEPSPEDPGFLGRETPEGLSDPVRRAVEPAAARVMGLVEEALAVGTSNPILESSDRKVGGSTS
jgi:hydrogenase maturation protease